MKTKIGFDLVEISRFEKHTKKEGDSFLNKIFSEIEMSHCFSYKNPNPHFAGIFAAKEAVSKALGTEKYPWFSIEIRHEKNGKPVAFAKNKKLFIGLSITHTKEFAGAVALV